MNLFLLKIQIENNNFFFFFGGGVSVGSVGGGGEAGVCEFSLL